MSETPEQFLENQLVNQKKSELFLKELGNETAKTELGNG